MSKKSKNVRKDKRAAKHKPPHAKLRSHDLAHDPDTGMKSVGYNEKSETDMPEHKEPDTQQAPPVEQPTDTPGHSETMDQARDKPAEEEPKKGILDRLGLT